MTIEILQNLLCIIIIIHRSYLTTIRQLIEYAIDIIFITEHVVISIVYCWKCVETCASTTKMVNNIHCKIKINTIKKYKD